ncbi:MAG: hypothetical protein HQL31_11550 [Planctomycetes bacterium]|nr:hypothetical protein [Planctomycetota bacterium]
MLVPEFSDADAEVIVELPQVEAPGPIETFQPQSTEEVNQAIQEAVNEVNTQTEQREIIEKIKLQVQGSLGE